MIECEWVGRVEEAVGESKESVSLRPASARSGHSLVFRHHSTATDGQHSRSTSYTLSLQSEIGGEAGVGTMTDWDESLEPRPAGRVRGSLCEESSIYLWSLRGFMSDCRHEITISKDPPAVEIIEYNRKQS